MTTTQMIEVLQAFEEGKMIEAKVSGINFQWVECFNPTWDFNKYEYRVKHIPTREEIIKEINSEYVKMCNQQLSCDVCQYDNSTCNMAFMYDYLKEKENPNATNNT